MLIIFCGGNTSCITIISIPAFYTGHNYVVRHFPERFTGPLEPTLTAELCKTLQLTEQDSRCQGKDTYAFEFFPDFRNRYARWTPRQQVTNEIDAYLVSCDDWIITASDGILQYCYYDFNGDGIFTLNINFLGDPNIEESGGVVWTTCTYAIRNSSILTGYACNPPLSW